MSHHCPSLPCPMCFPDLFRQEAAPVPWVSPILGVINAREFQPKLRRWCDDCAQEHREGQVCSPTRVTVVRAARSAWGLIA